MPALELVAPPEPDPAPAAFAVRGIRKSYGGVPVLKGIDLEVRSGEVHALLGANGAGKSTLIKCMSGATSPDAGQIVVGGLAYEGLSPRQARRIGISVIYQELSVAKTLTVADNIFLGNELARGPVVDRRRQLAEAEDWLALLGLTISPRAILGDLGAAEAQAVEIVKALRTDPALLILDEPTASLTTAEAQKLGDQVRALRERRIPLLYITHRLDEVFALADRVTILRGGEVVLSAAVPDVSKADLVNATIGRQLRASSRTAGTAGSAPSPRVLACADVVGPGLGPLSLELHAGEIVGLFGLVGSGRTELLETLFGAAPLHAGALELDGARLELGGPADAVAAGIALVPSDRAQRALFGELSAWENVLLPVLGGLARHGARRRPRERGAFEAIAKTLDLQPHRPELEAGRFSGGNQQKLVIGRWLQRDSRCRVLLLDEPTQGVDVGARGEMYEALRAFVRGGGAALVASSEPGELEQIADRVAVLSRGRIVATLAADDINEQQLMHLAHLGEPSTTEEPT